MAKYYELSEDTIARFEALISKKAFPMQLSIAYIGKEQKKLIELKKIPEQYEFLLNKSLMVTIDDDLFSLLDEQSIEILFTQELDKIEINTEKGTLKVVNFDFATFQPIINKYGSDAVMRAQSVIGLYNQQKKDGQENIDLPPAPKDIEPQGNGFDTMSPQPQPQGAEAAFEDEDFLS